MQKKNRQVLEIILSLVAIILMTSIFLKAIIDLDANYDVGWYHLPFAARIWGIVPEQAYIAEKLIEYRYDGFPLLAHFFQGLLWKVTGRIQATNLVGYFSLIIYFLLLRKYFRVPLYLSVIAVFTIPTVLTHAATSFVDLPGNVALSMLMMMVYLLFKESRLPSRQELLIAVLSAAAAANIKPQLQPIVFLVYCTAVIRLVWLYFKYTNNQRKLWLTVPLAMLASILIFATPIKNVALYGNPFYPIKIEVAGIVLNHKLTPETYSEGNRPQKWLQSILEINTPQWTADQWNQGDERYFDRAGGFFGVYVIFNLLLLLAFSINERLSSFKSRQAITALVIVLLMSVVTANFPQSHELRYLMFWMISLVSFNLYLISSGHDRSRRWLQPKYFGMVYLLFLVIVCIKINNFYLKPVFTNFDAYLNRVVKTELLDQMTPNERTCMISLHAIPNPRKVPFAQIQNAFYYSSYFHPDREPYSIRVAVEPESCGDLKVIPRNAQKFMPPPTE